MTAQLALTLPSPEPRALTLADVRWRLDEDSARWSLRGGLRGRALVGTIDGVLGLRVWVGPWSNGMWGWSLYAGKNAVRADWHRLRRHAKHAAAQALVNAVAAYRHREAG